jgi:hypothetical protein
MPAANPALQFRSQPRGWLRSGRCYRESEIAGVWALYQPGYRLLDYI